MSMDDRGDPSPWSFHLPYQRVLIAPSMSEQLQECTSIHKLPPSLILLLFDTGGTHHFHWRWHECVCFTLITCMQTKLTHDPHIPFSPHLMRCEWLQNWLQNPPIEAIFCFVCNLIWFLMLNASLETASGMSGWCRPAAVEGFSVVCRAVVLAF